jgi:vacuolar-type H+-ATPase subunit E/Vma4
VGERSVVVAVTARPLLDELRHNAAQEAQGARDRASREAAEIREAAAAVAGQQAEAARTAAAQAAAHDMSVAEADALRRMNERLLPARAAALGRIFARALVHVEARATHPGLGDAIAALTHDALAYLPTGAVRARCPLACTDAVRRALDHAGCSDATVIGDPSVPVGVMVMSSDGTIEVDATFARRLARERAVLATEIARQLLEPGP